MSGFEKIEKNKVKLTIDVPLDLFESGIVAVYNKQKSRFNIPGFRKGKVPRKIVEQQFGKGIFYEDAFSHVFPECYDKAVKEHDLNPVDRPEIDIVDMDPAEKISFTATVTVRPEVVLGEYKGITLDKVVYNVKAEDVDGEVEKARERVARVVDVTDRAVEDGDMLMIDYSGSVDGVRFDGGTAENQPLTIGSGSFIPGFEEQLISMNIDEERDITVVFPEEYHAEELAGKAAVFHVKVLSMKQKILPELNDEFAKDVSEFDTLDEYRADITKKLEEDAQKRADGEMENGLLDKVADNAECEIPPVMIERELDDHIRDIEMRLYYQGIKLDDYLKHTGMTIEQLRDQNREVAEKRVKIRLVLEAIIKTEDIAADEEGINREIEEMAKWAGKPTEGYKESVTPDQMEYISNRVLFDNAIKFLKEKNMFE